LLLSLPQEINFIKIKHMKKLYTLAFIALSAIAVNAQTNLVSNGDFEAWDNTTSPTGYSPAPFTASVSQETVEVHQGTYAAKHQTAATSSVKLQNEVENIVPGHRYTISYWFKDNDPNARARMWSYWLDSTFTSITEGNDNDALLRPATYSEDNAQWLQYTVTVTAPANASILRLETRSYAQAAGSGVIYYDDFSVVDITTAGVKSNEIAGLKVYPNPLTENVLHVTSNSNAVKSVAVYDVLGKQVINTTTVNGEVNASNLNAGVYIVKITEAGKTATKKLVVR
jgi:hypothetical protein